MGANIDQKLIKIEVQDREPLGIDLSSMLVGFGRQSGRENRAKIDKKLIQTGIIKMVDKLGASWRVLGLSLKCFGGSSSVQNLPFDFDCGNSGLLLPRSISLSDNLALQKCPRGI